MYIIQDNKNYYLKDLFTGELFEFKGRKLFIAYLKSRSSFYTKKGTCKKYMDNCFIDSLNLSGSDTSNYYRYEYKDGISYIKDIQISLKRYLFFDEDYSIININLLQKEIENCQEDYYELIPKSERNSRSKYYLFKRKQRDSFKFRKDPIPYRGGRHKGRSHKGHRIKQSKVQSSIPEYKKYIKPRRNVHSLPDGYEFYRSNYNNKCWKNCKKIKKQWMKRTF